jgi:hypothetical protein
MAVTLRRLILLVLAFPYCCGAALAPNEVEFFERKIRPVLSSECAECHGAKKQKGGLRVDFRDGLLKGGENGAAIVPGEPAKSLLLAAIKHADPDLAMPQKRPKLNDATIAAVEQWIAMGAPDPRDDPPREDAAVPWDAGLRRAKAMVVLSAGACPGNLRRQLTRRGRIIQSIVSCEQPWSHADSFQPATPILAR